MPKISIVITAYNAEPFIAAALDSVLAQSFADFEAIVINDGSSDGTPAILDSYASRDPRFRIFHRHNQGPAGALNAGLRLASGEYIALLDGDDRFLPNKLERQVAALDAHPEIDLNFTWSIWIDAQGRPLGIHSAKVSGRLSYLELLEDFVIGNTSSVVFRRRCLDLPDPCDPTLAYCYDLDLFLRIAMLRPGNVEVVPQVLTEYRRHPGQISRNRWAMEPEWDRVVEKLRARSSLPGAARSLIRGQSNMARYFAFLAYESGQYRDAAGRLLASLRRHPWLFLANRRNWMLAGAVASALLLPRSLHRRLEQWAGLRITASG